MRNLPNPMAHPASALADEATGLVCPAGTESLPGLPLPAPEAPLAAPVLSARERFEAIHKQYGNLIKAIVGKVGRRLGWRRDTFRAGLLQDVEQEVLPRDLEADQPGADHRVPHQLHLHGGLP